MSHLPSTARDLMNQDVYTLAPEIPIFEAAGRLLRHHVSGAPVVDGEGDIIGILSEHDLLRALCCVERGETPKGTVRDWMSAVPVTVEASDGVFALARFFEEHDIRRVPVTEDGQLCGLIARQDVVRALHRLALEARRAEADHRPPPEPMGGGGR